jgi:Fe-S-cluster containining protein
MTKPTALIDTPPTKQPATCARCGDCCERFALATDQGAFAPTSQDPPDGYRGRDPEWEDVWLEWDKHLADVAFQRVHFHPLMADGKQVRDKTSDRGYYTCDAFDPTTRLCTAHADRPDTCRGYPWYDGGVATRMLPSRCSFWHDVPPDRWPPDADPLPRPENDPVIE